MVSGFADHDDRVMVDHRGRASFAGSALIGADGLRSRVRAQLLGDGDPRPIGFVAHRTIVPMSRSSCRSAPRLRRALERDRAFTSSTIRCVTERCSTSSRCSAAPPIRSEATSRPTGPSSTHTYRSAHPSMKALLAMMDLERRWAVGDRDPIRHWHKGRVVLLGDAAHPTLQSLAQGACMAIEDGLCLAELCIRCHGRLRPGIPALCGRPRGADGARDAGIALSLGRLSRRTASRGKCIGRCWANAPSATSSSVWPGSTTASSCPTAAIALMGTLRISRLPVPSDDG